MSQTHMAGQRHFDVFQLALKKPHYLASIGLDPNDPRNEIYMYTNMVVSYWYTLWRLDEMPSDALHQAFSEMFRSEDSRAWWERHGERWTSHSDRRAKSFMEIMSHEYQSATSNSRVASVKSVDAEERSNGRQQMKSARPSGWSFTGGLAVGALIGLAAIQAIKVRQESRIKQ